MFPSFLPPFSFPSDSPPFIPEVGTNVEVITGESSELETALTRPEHAGYMKRAISEGEGEAEEETSNHKMPRIGSGERGGCGERPHTHTHTHTNTRTHTQTHTHTQQTHTHTHNKHTHTHTQSHTSILGAQAYTIEHRNNNNYNA